MAAVKALRQRLCSARLPSGGALAQADWRAKENLQAARGVRHSVRDLSEHGVCRASLTGQNAGHPVLFDPNSL